MNRVSVVYKQMKIIWVKFSIFFGNLKQHKKKINKTKLTLMAFIYICSG